MHRNITRKLVWMSAYWDFCSSSASICEWKLEENSKQAFALLLDINKIFGIDIWYIDEKRQKIFMILAEDLPAFGKPNSGTSRSSLWFHLVSLILVDVSSVSGLCLIWSKLILTLTSFLINTFLFNNILSDLKKFDNKLMILIISCLILSNLIIILKFCLIVSFCLIIVYYSFCL